jgi:fatty acid-binding protein DegV
MLDVKPLLALDAAGRVVPVDRVRGREQGLATGVLGTHVGPGTWAVCWPVEDGTPTGPREAA